MSLLLLLLLLHLLQQALAGTSPALVLRLKLLLQTGERAALLAACSRCTYTAAWAFD